MAPKVIFLILNWKKPEETLACIRSCRAVDYPNYEILVINNAGGDDSVAELRRQAPDLPIIDNAENYGYAGGNNVGLEAAVSRGGDYFFILNNDIIADPGTLTPLVRYAESHPETGFLAPKVLFEEDRRCVNSLGTSIDWLRLRPHLGDYRKKDGAHFSSPRDREILMGCALFFSRSTLQRAGFIDERFFIFHEEADWCLRNRRSGFRNTVVPEAVVYHKESKTMREYSDLSYYYGVRNFLYLSAKNASLFDRLKVLAGVLVYSLKHGLARLGPDRRGRQRSGIFFAALHDYTRGILGRCRRNFPKTPAGTAVS